MGQERLGALHVLMHFIIKTIQHTKETKAQKDEMICQSTQPVSGN